MILCDKIRNRTDLPLTNRSYFRNVQFVDVSKIDGLAKSPQIVMPVPDQVRDDRAGIQNPLNPAVIGTLETRSYWNTSMVVNDGLACVTLRDSVAIIDVSDVLEPAIVSSVISRSDDILTSGSPDNLSLQAAG